jgi:hypothetical protein
MILLDIGMRVPLRLRAATTGLPAPRGFGFASG